MSQLKILSPLSGQVWSLERVPDPVFAQKMVGDGLSIDPTDAVLMAACDGEVVSLHAAGHAVTLRTAEGVEVLMHVGIDTVAMKGEGFKPRIKIGDKVKAGMPLIEFDLDFLATHAKSLLTQVVIVNSERVKSWERASGHVVAGKDTLFTVTLNGEAAAKPANGAAAITSEAILIPNPTGLHARPAAVLANLAKSFQSAIKLQCGDRQANARSVTAIMSLEIAHGAKGAGYCKRTGREGCRGKACRRAGAGLRRRRLQASLGTGQHDDLGRRCAAAEAEIGRSQFARRCFGVARPGLSVKCSSFATRRWP
jgi:phosphocarrier protein FPr